MRGLLLSASERFVRVTGADWARLGDLAERFAHFTGRGNEAFMRMSAGHCAALEVRPGTGPNPQPDYFCTIYDRRPQICRDLERGSPECEGGTRGQNAGGRLKRAEAQALQARRGCCAIYAFGSVSDPALQFGCARAFSHRVIGSLADYRFFGVRNGPLGATNAPNQ